MLPLFESLWREAGLSLDDAEAILTTPAARAVLGRALTEAAGLVRHASTPTLPPMFPSFEEQLELWKCVWEDHRLFFSTYNIAKPTTDLLSLTEMERCALAHPDRNPFVQAAIGFSTGDALRDIRFLETIASQYVPESEAGGIDIDSSMRTIRGTQADDFPPNGFYRRVIDLHAISGVPLDTPVPSGRETGLEVLCLAISSPGWRMRMAMGEVPGIWIHSPNLHGVNSGINMLALLVRDPRNRRLVLAARSQAHRHETPVCIPMGVI